MTVGYFSPMPPARTGVADYSAALVTALRRFVNVTIDDGAATIPLYHLGNNQLHRRIYHRALADPGVVVLHDATLHHFFLGSLTPSQYIDEFVYNYGEWNAGLAGRLWQNRARSGTDPAYYRFPMLKRVAETARAVVVHNPAAARIVRDHVPKARIFEIPHLLLPTERPPSYDVQRTRARLGVTPSTCLFGVFGHLRESKRLESLLRAFRMVRDATGSAASLLVAGEFASSDLARAMEGRLQPSAGIRRIGYTPDREFGMYAAAVDACINLRYPTAGETSGIAIRLMALGKPVLITGGEETSRIPEAAVIRIDPGPAETDMLADYMLWLVRFHDDALAIGARARRHVEEHHAPERVARLYWDAMTVAYA